MRWCVATVCWVVALVRRLSLVSAILVTPVALVVSLSLSGCIRVSPNAEVVDCALAFLDAVASGDLTAMTELTFNRPDGWEIAVGALQGASVVGVERSGDRAQVSVRLERGAGGSTERATDESTEEFLDEVGLTEQSGQASGEELIWVVDLQRIKGTWLVDLAKALGLG